MQTTNVKLFRIGAYFGRSVPPKRIHNQRALPHSHQMPMEKRPSEEDDTEANRTLSPILFSKGNNLFMTEIYGADRRGDEASFGPGHGAVSSH